MQPYYGATDLPECYSSSNDAGAHILPVYSVPVMQLKMFDVRCFFHTVDVLEVT